MPHVLITGASRGIGRSLALSYRDAGWQVSVGVREPKAAALPAPINVHQLDVGAPDSFAGFAEAIGTPVDVLVNNAGIFGPRPQTTAEIDAAGFAEILAVNTIAPILLARALLHRMAQDGQRKLVTISSRMGSLGENDEGSAPMYRASKSAVNMLMQCLSLELAPQGFGVLLVHPGWVRTDMGTEAATLDVEESVAGVVKVINTFDPAEQLAFRAWDGRNIAW